MRLKIKYNLPESHQTTTFIDSEIEPLTMSDIGLEVCDEMENTLETCLAQFGFSLVNYHFNFEEKSRELFFEAEDTTFTPHGIT
jgi:hypothetical protein